MGLLAAAGQMVREVLGVPKLITLDLPPAATFDTAPQPIDRLLSAMRAGTGPISRTEAMQVSAVQRGRNELCSIATLPLKLYRGLDVMPSALFRQFDPDVPNVVHLAFTVEDLALESIAWWRITGRDFDRYPVSVRRVDPASVSLTDPSGRLKGEAATRWVWITGDDGKAEQVAASEMIRFDSPNPGILASNGRQIRIARQLDVLTEMYANNPALREFFTDNPDNTDADPMTDDEVEGFLAEYGAMRNLRPYGYIPGSLKRADVTSPSPKDLTLVELRDQINLALANGLGVDPEDLGVSTTSRTYQNAVDRKQDKINRVYSPYMLAITDRLAMGDVTRYGYAPRFDLTDYLKSSPNEQADYWNKLKGMGVTDAAEIRGWAGLSGPPPAAAAPAPAAAQASLRGAPAAQFDNRPVATFAAGDFATDATPAPTVDTAARTITGLAVPYNAVAEKYGMKLRFLPGSLEYSAPERMAHLKDHGTPVGYHRSVTDTADGPLVELAVLDGPEGSAAKAERDQLLYDAQHGLYSGLSIGVDYSFDPEVGDIVYNEPDGVYDIVRATWRETSTTYLPAFDDARVTRVAASHTGGPMKCPHCGHEHAPNMSCATFARQLTGVQPAPPTPAPNPTPPGPAPAPSPADGATFAQFQQWLTTQQAAGLQMAGSPLAGPSTVSPHRHTATVVEPAPYRFDRRGNLRQGSHDFSSDLFAGWHNGEQSARDRAETFLKDYFEAQDFGGAAQPAGQFAITPANVVNLNYPANHPEMYVDQMEYQYPVWDAVNKGTLDTVTPFVIPKFNSSSGLVADHVTGTEPTPGTFTATAQTITPSAVSGKVEITREAFDQGGNPQMSGLIWRQMVRGYYEALEAYVVAQLALLAASITDITITTAAADSVLDQAISAALVPLQYVRGGDRFDTVFTQIDLYKAMAGAKDSSGRRLYPMINPQNANGTTARGYTSIDAHGKLWVPAWATAASGIVAATSWMFDREKVCAWASAPQRIDLQWRVAWVDVGIWGYKAFGVTDVNGVREVVYDPV
jgi:hypothetical protein